jgi:hypothetical protein
MSHFVTKKADGAIAVTHLSPVYIAKCAKDGISEAIAVAAHIEELKARGQIAEDDEVVGGSEIELPLKLDENGNPVKDKDGGFVVDKEFRAAWCFTTPSPKIDICPHGAVEATKERLRAERAPELAKLDVEFQRALEADDKVKQSQVASKKQALRDITATVPAPPEGMEVADEDFLNGLRAVKIPKN